MPYGGNWKKRLTTLKITVMATRINKDKHVWEGWTVGDFIEELEPVVAMIMDGQSGENRSKANRNLPTGARTTSPITRNAYRA